MKDHSFIHSLLVIYSVPYESVNLSINLSQQIGYLRRIMFASIGDLRRQDPTILIHTEV
jgi:hypothetical protein